MRAVLIGNRAPYRAGDAARATRAGQELLGRLTDAATRPGELLVIRRALTKCGYDRAVVARLWAELEGLSHFNDGQLRVAGALAEFDPDNPRLAGPSKTRRDQVDRREPVPPRPLGRGLPAGG